MKKTYTTPQANVISLQMEAQILGASQVHNEVSNSEQLSNDREWGNDSWSTTDVEEDF